MQINLIPDASVSEAPAGFTAAIQAAADIFEQDFSGNYTLNIAYGWGTYENQAMAALTNASGSLGGVLDGVYVSYATLDGWLAANATSPYQRAALASLPSSAPQSFFVSSAQQKALGEYNGSATALDGAIGIGTATSSSDWLVDSLQEISHALGRLTDYYAGAPTIMDLFRYSAPDTYQWTGGASAYFSIDGGVTDLANFSTISDYTDFANDALTPNDMFNWEIGANDTLSSTDLELMNVIGFGLSGSTASLSIAAAPASNPPADSPTYPQVTGNVAEWIMSNGAQAADAGPGSIPSGYQVAGVGNFTGGATDDILWYNGSTGDTQEWLINDGAWAGTVELGTHPGNFQIAGVGDFTGDGIDDVLWTGTSASGQVQTDVWELNSSGQWTASVNPGSHPAGYEVVGVADLTGNGTSDILWQNATTGDVDEWEISNGQWAGSVDLGSHPGTGWTIAGVGDLFGNGTDAILWTNSSNGQVQTDVWQLGANGQWTASLSAGQHPAGYQVAAMGDFTGNGTDDILWYNPSSGDVDEWTIANGQWTGSVDLGTSSSGGSISGVGAFTGSQSSDVLWYNTKAA